MFIIKLIRAFYLYLTTINIFHIFCTTCYSDILMINKQFVSISSSFVCIINILIWNQHKYWDVSICFLLNPIVSKLLLRLSIFSLCQTDFPPMNLFIFICFNLLKACNLSGKSREMVLEFSS